MKSFVIMLRNQSGNTAAEYALIIALVGSAVALASISLGNTIADAFNGVANTIAKCSSSAQC
jgi:pilus assembly protein Flp/PilA